MGFPAYAPFTVSQREYIARSRSSWLSVAEGGKRAGKNVINILAWAICLDTHPERLHLAAGVSIGTARLNILDSNGFGLSSIFGGRCRVGKYMGKEALFSQTRSGEKIVIFAGGAKANDAAYIKGNTFGSAYITEANECHQTFIQEVLDRTLSSKRRQIFMDLNPKPPRHWFYTDFLDFQDRLRDEGKNPDYNYGHFDISSNRSLSDDTLKEILSKYDRSSVWYQADILGLRTASAGRIYPEYSYEAVCLKADRAWHYWEYAIGIDVGGTDATVATLVGITDRFEQVHLLDGVYHRQGLSDRMTEAKYAALIAEWIERMSKAYPGICTIYVDSAAKMFRICLQEELVKRQLTRFAIHGTDKGDGINQRIELIAQLLAQGRLKIARSLGKWHEAMQMATWSTKEFEKGNWVRLDDGSYPLDCLDSMEYAIYPYVRYLR